MTRRTIDGHVHIRDEGQIEHFAAIASELELSGMGLVCTERSSGDHDNADAFAAKQRRPGFFYVFGGLDHREAPALAEQVDRLHAAGADGIKLIESKPGMRKALGHRLDGPYFAPAFERIAAHGLPIVWHVADPEEFWNKEAIPAWAAERGWGYDDAHPTKESLYKEAETVLRRHPDLTVIFAHFYFMSAELDRLAGLFEEFPRLHVDLAPGIEMYYNLSQNPDRTREFFTTYAERIVYGTDLGIFPGEELSTSLARARTVLRFLETKDEFRLPPESDFLLGPPSDGVIRGLGLEEEPLAMILGGNYRRIVGAKPRPLDPEAAYR